MGEVLESQAIRFKIGQVLNDDNQSRLRKYQELVLGKAGFGFLLKYELIISLISWIPGALGLFLRSKFYPLILGKVGKNVLFGANVVFRHPHKILIGDNVIIDDNCQLDAKGATNRGIRIGSNVYLGRGARLSCKDGDIILKDHVNIGFHCQISSSNTVVLEEHALVASYSYIIGGGKYNLEITGLPISEQPIFEKKGGVLLEKNCWLGGRVTVLGEVTIGHDSAIGASSLVTSDIPPFSIAAGVPAKVVRERQRGAQKD